MLVLKKDHKFDILVVAINKIERTPNLHIWKGSYRCCFLKNIASIIYRHFFQILYLFPLGNREKTKQKAWKNVKSISPISTGSKVATICIFTDFPVPNSPILADIQHLYFSFKSFEVVSLVNASSGVFHLTHKWRQTFCIYAYTVWCARVRKKRFFLHRHENSFFFGRGKKVEKNSCTDNNFQTLLSLTVKFICSFRMRCSILST